MKRFLTSPKRINDLGPQGAILGILEYSSQSNNSSDCVEHNKRFDDLTVNVITIGLSSLNTRNQISNDLKAGDLHISSENLTLKNYCDKMSSIHPSIHHGPITKKL